MIEATNEIILTTHWRRKIGIINWT